MMLSTAAALPTESVQYMRDPRRLGPTFRAYRCSDGMYVHVLGYQSRRHTPSLLDALGLTELPEDPAAIDGLFLTKTAAAWEYVFDEKGVWYTRVARFDDRADVLGGGGERGALPTAPRGQMSRVAQQARDTDAFLKVGAGGAVVRAPISFHDGGGVSTLSSTPAGYAPPAPKLGEHTADVLREAGVAEAELKLLEAGGAFGQPSRPSVPSKL